MKTTDDQSETFIVVDKDDKILGYKTRAECHNDRSLIHRTVHVLVYNDHGELLVQKRSLTKDKSPGMFTLSATGHVTKGQSYEEAAKRELEEEIGVQTKLVHVTTYLFEGEDEQEMTAVFTGEYNGPFTTHEDEVDEVKFVSIEHLAFMIDKITDHAKETLIKLKLL